MRSTPQRFLLLLLGVACAGSGTHWERPCADAERFEAERQACIEASGDTSGVMHLTTKRFVERCLEERGWQQVADGKQLVCSSPSPSPESAESAESTESAPALDPSPAREALDFDTCFARCRELTERSKEACFDVCIGR